mmetsp:Transcript_30735/g.61543  ORF Transcript_30735/g.61543 Transcript_30735/m.61543 type:complete len:604 (+) Transcript_30735:75-1886(+)
MGSSTSKYFQKGSNERDSASPGKGTKHTPPHRDVTGLSFDVLRMAADLGKKQTLVCVATEIFRISGLLLRDEEVASRSALKALAAEGQNAQKIVVTWCSESTFNRWIVAVEAGYLDKQYHNSVHACDVMTTSNAYLIHSGIVPGRLPTTQKAFEAARTPAWSATSLETANSEIDTGIGFEDSEWRLTQLALLIAAAGHDVGHLGVMNPFLRQTKHALAAEYPDTLGVLEAFHAATALRLMSSEAGGHDVLENLSVDNARWVRQAVVDLILITDLTKQRAFLEQWHGRRQLVPAAQLHAATKLPDLPAAGANDPARRKNSPPLLSPALASRGPKKGPPQKPTLQRSPSAPTVDLEDGGAGRNGSRDELDGSGPTTTAAGGGSQPFEEGQEHLEAVWDLELCPRKTDRFSRGADLTRARAGRLELAKVLIKAADLSNPTKHPAAYFTWTCMILSEFYDQGEHEVKLGMPMTAMPQCDRSKADIVADQLGFLGFVVKPAFDALRVFSEDRDRAAVAAGHLREGEKGPLAGVFENLDCSMGLWRHFETQLPSDQRAMWPIPAELPLAAFPSNVDGASTLQYVKASLKVRASFKEVSRKSSSGAGASS